jgi:hypothetical protein
MFINKIEYNTITGAQEDIPKYLVKMDPGQAPHTKNRYGQNIPLELMLWRGHGIVNAYIIRKMLETYKYVSNNKDIYTLTPELTEFLGADALEEAGITDVTKVKRVPNMNRLCSLNSSRLMDWFKSNDIFKMKVGETEVDDGFYL